MLGYVRELPMLVTDQDVAFIKTGLQEFQGWCMDDAAYLTCSLLARQAETGHAGPLFEIGVYEGKFLSVLYHAAMKRGLPVAGVDTFQWSAEKSVTATFERVFGGTTNLRLVAADSTTFQVQDVYDLFGGAAPSFISVDGDHSARAVASDMWLADRALAPGGVVALDDFLNSRAIGVGEGAYRYLLLQPGARLRPFAYAANKLFLARPEYHELYRAGLESFVDERPELSMAFEFRRLEKIGRNHVEQSLVDSPVLIF
jgi:hypothetical protein